MLIVKRYCNTHLSQAWHAWTHTSKWLEMYFSQQLTSYTRRYQTVVICNHCSTITPSPTVHVHSIAPSTRSEAALWNATRRSEASSGGVCQSQCSRLLALIIDSRLVIQEFYKGILLNTLHLMIYYTSSFLFWSKSKKWTFPNYTLEAILI